MKVIFFTVDDVLNFPESDAIAPSGKRGIAEARIKDFKKIVSESGARIVLIGSWKTDWDFDDSKCTPDGTYLNKKLNKKGLHILDKTANDMADDEGINEYIRKHPNITESCVLKNINEINWKEW